MWFFGLWWMVGSAIVLVTLLVCLDHAGISGFGARESDEIDDVDAQQAKQEVVRRLSVWPGAVSETSGLDLLPPAIAEESRQRARAASGADAGNWSVENSANVEMVGVSNSTLEVPQSDLNRSVSVV